MMLPMNVASAHSSCRYAVSSSGLPSRLSRFRRRDAIRASSSGANVGTNDSGGVGLGAMARRRYGLVVRAHAKGYADTQRRQVGRRGCVAVHCDGGYAFTIGVRLPIANGDRSDSVDSALGACDGALLQANGVCGFRTFAMPGLYAEVLPNVA
jgi:hypothetical protein